MAYEPRPGDGALFKNEYKTDDRHPNAKGYVIAHRDIRAGERLELAAWTKDSAKGKFQSLKLSDAREKRDTPVADNTKMGRDTAPRRQEPDHPADFDSDVPF